MRKNLRVVLGKPMVSHAMQAAFDASRVDYIYVSSDEFEILELAKKMGVNAIHRAPEAASDESTADDVVLDFLGQLPQSLVASNPYLVYLQPTSPLRTGAHIDAAFDAMSSASSDVCLSVVELTKTPFKSFRLTVDGRLQALFDEAMTNANRQNFPTVYYPNGAIYVFPIGEFLLRGAIPSNGGVPYIMSEHESIDIDTEEDLAKLENLCRPN